jgi:hypothetical protein
VAEVVDRRAARGGAGGARMTNRDEYLASARARVARASPSPKATVGHRP